MNSRTTLMPPPKIWKIFSVPKGPVQFLEEGEKRLLKEDYHTKSTVDTRDFFSSLFIPVIWNPGRWWFAIVS